MVKTREMYSLANNEPGVNVEQVKINELYSFEGHRGWEGKLGEEEENRRGKYF